MSYLLHSHDELRQMGALMVPIGGLSAVVAEPPSIQLLLPSIVLIRTAVAGQRKRLNRGN